MQTLRIAVVRSRKYRATDGFQVISDHGSGTLDGDHPETARPVMFWEDAPGGAGQHLRAHLLGAHFDGLRPDGHLEGTHLLDEQAYPAATLVYESAPLVFGRFQYAVMTQDAAGNALTEGLTVHEAVINSAPPPAADLHMVEHPLAHPRYELSFTPSPRLIG
jgi:hypothetical protein